MGKFKEPKSLEDRVEEEKKNALERALGFLNRKKSAYRTLFRDGNSPMSRIVLKDLADFCRIGSSTFRKDSREHALLEGRREVFQRILDYQNISAEELLQRVNKSDS